MLTNLDESLGSRPWRLEAGLVVEKAMAAGVVEKAMSAEVVEAAMAAKVAEKAMADGVNKSAAAAAKMRDFFLFSLFSTRLLACRQLGLFLPLRPQEVTVSIEVWGLKIDLHSFGIEDKLLTISYSNHQS